MSAVAPAAQDSERGARVLLVIGDRLLANTVDLILRHGRRSEGTVKDASAVIAEWKPHLYLVDVDLEGGAAVQLIDEARAAGPIGIIALTRRRAGRSGRPHG